MYVSYLYLITFSSKHNQNISQNLFLRFKWSLLLVTSLRQTKS